MDARTGCPEIDLLERYLRGDLQERERREILEHLELCGLCSVLAERLTESDEEADAVAVGPEPDWSNLERRIEAECRKAQPSGHGVAWAGWLPHSRWVAAVCSCLVIILLYPAWLGITRSQQSAPDRTSDLRSFTGFTASGAIVVDLNTTRSDAGHPTLTAGPGEEAAALLFFAPAPDGTRFTARIVDRERKTLVELGEVRSYDGKGNFCVVVNPNRLAPGRYGLVVQDKLGAAQRETTFDFVRQ